MAEPSKSYVEEPSDKQEEEASEPVPAPQTPETPPETPPLRIQVDGRETTEEPRIVGDNGIPAPAVRRRRKRKSRKRAAAPSTLIFNFAPPNVGVATLPAPASRTSQPAVPAKQPRPILRVVSVAQPARRIQPTNPPNAPPQPQPQVAPDIPPPPNTSPGVPPLTSPPPEPLPQPHVATSAPPPPVVPPVGMPTPDQQPGQPAQAHGGNMLALLLGVLAIVALLLWLVAGAPPIGRPFQETISNLLPGKPVVPSTPSPDNLYGFTIAPPTVDGKPFTRIETTGNCQGTMFTSYIGMIRSGAPVYPLLQVCYLGFDTGNPPNDVNGQLRARADRVEREVLSGAREGLIRYTEIGQDRIAGQEVYIRGQDRETGKEIEWYESTVQYADRFYAIEAADLVSNWDEIWPAFSDAIATLLFANGVVIPPNAPIVLP